MSILNKWGDSMGDVLKDKIVKTRKEHSCFSCGGKCLKGQQARSITYTWDGEIFNVYECQECIKYRNEVCSKCKGNVGDYYCYDDHEGAYHEEYIAECIMNSGGVDDEM